MSPRSTFTPRLIAIGVALSSCLACFAVSSWHQRRADALRDRQLALISTGRKVDELTSALGELAQLPDQRRLAAKLEAEAASSPALAKLEAAVPTGVVVQQLVAQGAP